MEPKPGSVVKFKKADGSIVDAAVVKKGRLVGYDIKVDGEVIDNVPRGQGTEQWDFGERVGGVEDADEKPAAPKKKGR